jgi:hypothetical protein
MAEGSGLSLHLAKAALTTRTRCDVLPGLALQRRAKFPQIEALETEIAGAALRQTRGVHEALDPRADGRGKTRKK